MTFQVARYLVDHPFVEFSHRTPEPAPEPTGYRITHVFQARDEE